MTNSPRSFISILAVIGATLAVTVSLRAEPEVSAGTAKGSLAYEGATAELKYAAAFVDQKDERKPVCLIISDMKLPTEKWTSEFDMMRDNSKWSGLMFCLDKEGNVFRSDVHMKGKQASVSGIFDFKLNDPTSKELAGTAKTEGDKLSTKLDLTFHTAAK